MPSMGKVLPTHQGFLPSGRPVLLRRCLSVCGRGCGRELRTAPKKRADDWLTVCQGFCDAPLPPSGDTHSVSEPPWSWGQVSDEGGGIPRSGLPRIWTYLYSTAPVATQNQRACSHGSLCCKTVTPPL